MKNRVTPENIVSLKDNEIFVFGSNLNGHHLGGAAKQAWSNFGAVWGRGIGHSGQSYAIPTMEGFDFIEERVNVFLDFAEINPHITYLVTEIGCGIAGYTPEEIAPLFKDALDIENIHLPESFWKILNTNKPQLHGLH